MAFTDRLHNRGSISTGYDIDNSLKLEADNTECINTPASYTSITVSNVYKGTTSFWIKRTSLNNGSGVQWIVNGSNSARYDGIYFDVNDKLKSYFSALGNGADFVTTQVFRDTSAWYHIVMAIDTSHSTASERIKIYVNGEQITAWDTSPSIDQNTQLTSLGTDAYHGWGTNYSYNLAASDGALSGYLANCIHIDGQQLDFTDFGEFDEDTGIWKPKEYTGTYGNKGYLLEFKSSSALGTDTSGNGNDFTTNRNITSADQATDTPTNNFCTLNFNTGYIQGSDATTFTQGATTRQGGTSSYNGALGTIGINPFVGSAKWYWEVELSADNNGNGIELAAGWLATSIAQSNTANKAVAGNSAGFQIWTSTNWSPPNEGTGADGDIFGFLLQCDSSSPSLKIYKNDTLFATRTQYLPYDFENDFYFPVVFIYNTGLKAFCNFGNPFDATVSSGNTDPNGYGNFEFDTKGGYALCSRNLSEFG